MNENQLKIVDIKLEKLDLIAILDDQRFHDFSSK